MPAEVASRTIRAGSRLERILASGEFAVTAEIAPPASVDASEIRRHASLYRGTVDACNLTDGQRARGSIPRIEGGFVRQASREGHRRRRLRPDAGRLRRRRIRGMDASRQERMAPR